MQFVPGKLKNVLNRYRKTDEEVKAYQEGIELEKGDLPAMVIASLVTFLPVAIIAMLFIYGLLWILVT